MANMDAQLLFSDAQAITATAASTNSIDVGAARNLGVGNPLYIVAIVDTAFTDGSSDSTVTVTLETDSDPAFGSPTVAQTLFTFAALSAAGTKKQVAIAVDAANERYMQLRYTLANGNLTTGAITAYLTPEIEAITHYADNITIT